MKLPSSTFMASIVVALCCLLSLGAQAQVSDNFNAGNDAGWTRYDPLAPFGAPATYSFPNGGYRIQAPASPDPLTLGPARAGSLRTDQSDASDFGIFFDVVGWDNAANQSFGALGRATSIGLGTTDGYGLTYSTAGSLDLVRIAVDGQVGNLKVVHDVSKGGADGKIQAALQRRVVVGAGIDDLEGGDVDAGP